LPGQKHLRGRGVTAKQQRQYEHILANARKSGRYGKRKKEVAARTVFASSKRHGLHSFSKVKPCKTCGFYHP